MNQTYRTWILLLSGLWLASCGGGSSSSTLAENDVIVQTKKSLIDSTQTEFYLEFSMQNRYAQGIEVELSDIVVDLNACTISNYTLNVVDHTILFNETDETHDLIFMAELSQPCTPTGYTVYANNHLTYEGTANSMKYVSDFQPIEIDGNITHPDTTSIFDYGVELRSLDDQPNIPLESQKHYKLVVFNLDNNSSLESQEVHSITIKSSDPSKAQLIDPTNYNNDQGEAFSVLTFNERNEIDLYVKTYDKSGVVYFDVSVSYSNNRGEIHDLETTMALTILSGEPTAFSINPAGVEYNFETKWFEEKFLISASDKYNNVVNVPAQINIAAMAEFTNDAQGDRILHGQHSSIKGEIIADSENHLASFEINSNLFDTLDTSRDFLLLFGNITANESLGKWDIDPYNYTSSSLELSDAYYGEDHQDLGFAVGHNYYNEICSSESKEWELKVDTTDGIYQLDEEGKTYVTLKFPAHMIGKKIALGVNFLGKDQRSGEVHFETLQSQQGVKTPETITIDAVVSTTSSDLNSSDENTTYVPAPIEPVDTSVQKRLTFEVDTGTEDRYWVRNARVVCNTKAENIEVTAFSENREIRTLSDCQGSENGDIAYWDITLELIDPTQSGSFSFEECQVVSFIQDF